MRKIISPLWSRQLSMRILIACLKEQILLMASQVKYYWICLCSYIIHRPAKLAVRTILRQNDNNEIKGYDLTYFSKDETGVSLWLGQAKLGGKAYCKTDINKDLLEKFTAEYLSKQIFLCVRKTGFSNRRHKKRFLKPLRKSISDLWKTMRRCVGKKLLDYFKSEGIRIKIPCLLAYGEKNRLQGCQSALSDD